MGFTLVVLVVMALPFLGGRGIARLPVAWPLRLILAAAVPALLLTWLATSPGDLAELGTAIAVFFVAVGWLLGVGWPAIVAFVRVAAMDAPRDVIASRDRDRLHRLR